MVSSCWDQEKDQNHLQEAEPNTQTESFLDLVLPPFYQADQHDTV